MDPYPPPNPFPVWVQPATERGAHVSEAMWKQAIGQTWMIGFRGTTLDEAPDLRRALEHDQVGAVILFAHNIQSPEQVQALNAQIHAASRGKALIAVDHEGGRITRLPVSKGFPVTYPLAEVGQWEDTRIAAYAQEMAQNLKALGFNFNLAPVLDVDVNPFNPVIAGLGRSAGAHPDRVTQVTRILAQAHAAAKIAFSFKHFPGHGSSFGDTHLGFVDVTDTWDQEKELAPYAALLDPAQGFGRDPLATVMMAHVVHQGLDPTGTPASLSQPIVHQMLRSAYQFDGVVIGDDIDMEAIATHYNRIATWAKMLNAGVDMLILGQNIKKNIAMQSPFEVIDGLYQALQAGQVHVDWQRLKTAQERIMRLRHAVWSAAQNERG